MVKWLSMILVVIYMAPPFQGPAGHVLHSISHIIDVPDQIITHNLTTKNEIEAVLEHRDHHTVNADHLHEFIDMLSSFFSSETQKKHQSVVELMDLDKHFISKIHHTSEYRLTLRANPNPFADMPIQTGFLPPNWKPPLH